MRYCRQAADLHVRREDLSGVGGVRRDDQANAAWILGRRYIAARKARWRSRAKVIWEISEEKDNGSKNMHYYISSTYGNRRAG
jgi:hypothetical protein